MLLLTDTNDKFQITTSAAATLDVYISYIDLSGTTVTPGKQLTAITSATTTDVCAAPGASTTRNVKTVNIRNKHASLSCDVTFILDDNGTDYEVFKATMRPGEVLEYVEGIGWFLVAAADVSKRVRLAADHTNSTITPTEATGLSTLTGTGTFKFQYMLRYTTVITTTGVRVSVNHDGTVSFFLAHMLWVDASATASTATPDGDAVQAAGHVYGSFAARAKSTAGWGTTLGIDTNSADLLLIIDGLVDVTVDGNLELWFGSEIAASLATLKSGSILYLEKIA